MTDSEKLDLLISKFEQVDARLDGIDARLDGMDAKFEQVDTTLKQMDARLKSLEDDNLQIKLRMMKYTAEIKAGDDLILDEVQRVHRILMDHMGDLSVHTA